MSNAWSKLVFLKKNVWNFKSIYGCLYAKQTQLYRFYQYLLDNFSNITYSFLKAHWKLQCIWIHLNLVVLHSIMGSIRCNEGVWAPWRSQEGELPLNTAINWIIFYWLVYILKPWRDITEHFTHGHWTDLHREIESNPVFQQRESNEVERRLIQRTLSTPRCARARVLWNILKKAAHNLHFSAEI